MRVAVGVESVEFGVAVGHVRCAILLGDKHRVLRVQHELVASWIGLLDCLKVVGESATLWCQQLA